MAARASAKPYLARRIEAADLAELAGIVDSIAEIVPRITQPIPAVARDPTDDYLIAYALVGRADYLVAGDADLLALGEMGGVKIVTQRAFVERL